MKSTSIPICLSEIFAIVRMKSSLKSSSHHGRARFLDCVVSLMGGGASGLAPGTMTMGRVFGGGTGGTGGARVTAGDAGDRLRGAAIRSGAEDDILTVAVGTLGGDILGFDTAGGTGGTVLKDGALAARGRIGGGGALGDDARGCGTASTETKSSGESSAASAGSDAIACSMSSSSMTSPPLVAPCRLRREGGTAARGAGACGARAAWSEDGGRRGAVGASSGSRASVDACGSAGTIASRGGASDAVRCDVEKRLSSKTITGKLSGPSGELTGPDAGGAEVDAGARAVLSGAGAATTGATSGGGGLRETVGGGGGGAAEALAPLRESAGGSCGGSGGAPG